MEVKVEFQKYELLTHPNLRKRQKVTKKTNFMDDIAGTRGGDWIPPAPFISVPSAMLQETLSSKWKAVGGF